MASNQVDEEHSLVISAKGVMFDSVSRVGWLDTVFCTCDTSKLPLVVLHLKTDSGKAAITCNRALYIDCLVFFTYIARLT